MDEKVEAEPPQKADVRYDIDPSMKIWKSMTGLDKDELSHQAQSLDSLPVDDTHAELLDEGKRLHLEPEEDRDHINHPNFINIAPEQPERDWDEVYHKGSHKPEPRVAYLEPETDKDDLYHRDDQLYLPPARHQMESPPGEARLHLHPEEDKDALYHGDVPELTPHQDDPKADPLIFSPSQRKYSEPEEDRDGLYHQ